jgi:hypothetical protein
MYRKHFDPSFYHSSFYHLLPPEPQANRRSLNRVVFSVLVFFTLGLLITGFVLGYAGVH